jgi:hypothetical protein
MKCIFVVILHRYGNNYDLWRELVPLLQYRVGIAIK